MSPHFILPSNENGLNLDADSGNDIILGMEKQVGFNRVFIFAHGWWTNAVRALQCYNRFTIEFSAKFRSAVPLNGLPTLSRTARSCRVPSVATRP